MQVRSLSQEDPLQKKMATTPVFLPGKSHGEKSLVGYGPVGCKASDTTEQLNTNTVIVVFNSGTVCGGVHTHKKVRCGPLVAQYFNRSLLYSLGTQNNQYVLLGGLGIGGPGLNGSLY